MTRIDPEKTARRIAENAECLARFVIDGEEEPGDIAGTIALLRDQLDVLDRELPRRAATATR